MILKFELTGDFEPYGGVNLGNLNSTVALTLPVGLIVHNFRANFAQKYDF